MISTDPRVVGKTGLGQKQSVGVIAKTVRSSAKGDIGLSIDCVRCTRKNSPWLAPKSGY